MFKYVPAFALWLMVASASWALGPDALPSGGQYVIKDNNIVAINGKTLIQDANTKLFACGGKEVPELPSGIFVTYTLKKPVAEPIPVLETVTEQCG